MDKKYWQSFGEFTNSNNFNQETSNEFKEELPLVSDAETGLLDAKTPRRDFLKYLGFTTAAAAVAASCEVPLKKAIPFANKPEDIVPGVSNYYATTFVQEGDAISVVAKVRDGRPIKLEGNELSPITEGGTSARVQASVLDLYDGARLRFPTIDGKEASFEDVDKAISSSINGSAVLLTSTVHSPTSLEVVKQFLAKYPGSKHVVYDAMSYAGLLDANQASYGKREIPSFRFDQAKVIVSIGADFLGTWLSPVEFARQYAKGRKLSEGKFELSKHIHFETVASLTGSNADERYLHRPSETAAVVSALYNAVNGGTVSGLKEQKLAAGIQKVAQLLSSHKGESLVVCGSNDVNIQLVVNAINELIGSNGKTIDWSSTYKNKQGNDAEFAKLVEDMNNGSVSTLIVCDANPAYTWCNAEKFVSGLKKVKTTISLNGKADETTQLCKFVVPDHHFLESWGDAEAKSNQFSFLQPTISPLFKTRQWQDSLLTWAGSTTNYFTQFKAFWTGKLGGESAFDKALQDGVYIADANIVKNEERKDGDFMFTTKAFSTATFNGAATTTALGSLSAAKVATGVELVVYEKVAIGANYGVSNPWLMEMPDPVTRATWDNYLIISPAKAKTLLNIDLTNGGQADAYEVQPPKHVAEIKANGKTVKLPVLIIPGTHPETVGIAVGFGRTPKIGRAAVTEENKDVPVGANAFPFTSLVGTTVSYFASNVEVKNTTEKYPVALTQTHNVYDTKQGKRTEVMKELALAELKEKPEAVLEEREEELAPFGGVSKFRKEGSPYPVYDKPGVKWGMSIDLNACNGCGACVVACTAENNVAVVGKPEVLRAHEMHWLRIDRYYSGNDLDNPNVVFQPLMCQHCDNAPCENVCPVAATNHSSEGLNQMTYNRCIGTRYCANNCPYKVRRFNWADYTGADSFKNNQDEMNDVVMYMNDDLTRMVLNPDVTVRSRGVIEKCSFCVQRLQEGKLKAKKESRPLQTSDEQGWDVKTACQQACATNAIVFGNVNDSKSAVSNHRKENNNRLFYSLEQLHVLPNVSYLAKVRNIEIEHKVEHKKEHKEEAHHG